MSEIPLGRREDQHLEFKSRDALENPEMIAREVVAMLNADGGEVWVGLREEEGAAVAVEAIPEPEREQRRLRDYLVDTIEPSPGGREVEVQGVGQILKVQVREGGRKPYAFLKRGGRHFVVRVGERMRPMSMEEIAQTFAGQEGARGARERAIERVLNQRQALQSEGSELFWLCLEPAQEIDIDLHDRRLEEVLLDPRLTGDRRIGWSFPGVDNQFSHRQERLLAESSVDTRVEIRRAGGITFSIPTSGLHWKGGEREIWPLALSEYTVSAFRTARSIYKGKLSARSEVLADLALTELHGWKLPYTLRGIWVGWKEYKDSTDFVLERPLVFTGEEISREPDQCGFRLVERVYEAFGMSREDIPKEFDRKTGRLILPE